ncbi:MAG: hypothetical protein J6A52_03860 [Bacilli bacterium]|nr:hypothetical protein [Bacilli bacterium]
MKDFFISDKLLLELALFINLELFNDQIISYEKFKETEKYILESLEKVC